MRARNILLIRSHDVDLGLARLGPNFPYPKPYLEIASASKPYLDVARDSAAIVAQLNYQSYYFHCESLELVSVDPGILIYQ